MDQALPGKYIDLIRDGASPGDLKAKGGKAVWSALVRTAMSAQARGWDEIAWVDLVLAPNSNLGFQAKSKGKDRTLPAMQVQRLLDRAWEKAWELRTERESQDPSWNVEQAAQEATDRAEAASRAVQDPEVDLTDNERAVLAHAIEQTRLRQWTNVALPRRAIYAATGLGPTATATALRGLEVKGLLLLERRGQNAANAKYRRASIYTLADVPALTAYTQDLTAALAAGPVAQLASVTPIGRPHDPPVQSPQRDQPIAKPVSIEPLAAARLSRVAKTAQDSGSKLMSESTTGFLCVIAKEPLSPLPIKSDIFDEVGRAVRRRTAS